VSYTTASRGTSSFTLLTYTTLDSCITYTSLTRADAADGVMRDPGELADVDVNSGGKVEETASSGRT